MHRNAHTKKSRKKSGVGFTSKYESKNRAHLGSMINMTSPFSYAGTDIIIYSCLFLIITMIIIIYMCEYKEVYVGEATAWQNLFFISS